MAKKQSKASGTGSVRDGVLLTKGSLPMTFHPSQAYAHPQSFDRLLCLIATLAQYPGVGHLNASNLPGRDEQAPPRLQELLSYLHAVAAQQQIALPPCSPHTLHKDLQTLRYYGILGDQTYRWGYYLGSSAMTELEFNTALSALHSQATYQRDPKAQEAFQAIVRRRWGKSHSSESFYPVRAQLNRSIIPTDPTRVSRKGSAVRTLYSALDTLEAAILQGQAIQICRSSDPYQQGQQGSKSIWPLQLIHYDIAWYLAYEQSDTQHLVIGRLDRFDDQCQVLSHPPRSRSQQLKRLKQVHELLNQGWGLFLGEPEEQRQELSGQLPFTEITVRFYGDTIPFIREGGYRHPSQKILTPSRQGQYLDYQVRLPPRSHGEFMRWVNRFMGNVQILTPPELAEQHAKLAEEQLQRYRSNQQAAAQRELDADKTERMG
ncbi:WYL domain-containing protein [Synechococcus sp. R55.3]|uniref:helix-turn-helix transcriptional regulator n=2 Tax=unclassified Synechococcus TaxID=2626047 RepID=UPI0039C0D23F